MKKSNFIRLILGTVGMLLFGVGLCMCLLPQWNAFREGVGVAAAGGVLLLALLFAILRGRGRKWNWRMVGKVAYGTVSALVLGVGMCLALVYGQMILGIVVGVAGIVMLLMLIPMCLGLK